MVNAFLLVLVTVIVWPLGQSTSHFEPTTDPGTSEAPPPDLENGIIVRLTASSYQTLGKWNNIIAGQPDASVPLKATFDLKENAIQVRQGEKQIYVPIKTSPLAMPSTTWAVWVNVKSFGSFNWVMWQGPDFGWSRAIALNDGRVGGAGITRGGAEEKGKNGWRHNSGLGSMPQGEWVHLAAVYRGDGTCEAWMNGVRGTQTTCQNGAGESIYEKLLIGMKGIGKARGVVLISDVWIYHRALRSNEVEALYARGVRPSATASVSPPVSPKPYVVGQPGAAWTEDEARIVKAKLYRMFRWILPASTTAGKALRLAFHDCMPHQDGSGGCNGCLDWEHVGEMFDEMRKQKHDKSRIAEAHNNGLQFIAEPMEKLYTLTDFPDAHTEKLELSLQEAGKSRADLWAFAALCAVEFTVDNNNKMVERQGVFGAPFDGVDYGWQAECLQHEQATVNLKRPFRFQTGRKDLCGDFRRGPKEKHPPVLQDGKALTIWFKDAFAFNGRETVAIMGAHTIGRMHKTENMFFYQWNTLGRSQWNNMYYKGLAGHPRFLFHQLHDGTAANRCVEWGPAGGGPAQVRWVPKGMRQMVNGGPVQWMLEKKVCPEECLPRNKKDWGKHAHCTKDKNMCIEGSEVWIESYDYWRKESALPVDVGLYLDFHVDETAEEYAGDYAPTGCLGLEGFTAEYWQTRGGNPSVPKNIKDGSMEGVGCGKNQHSEPAGSMSLYQIVEEYASNQDKFMEDFVPALEKMLANGYDAGELDSGPVKWTNQASMQADGWSLARHESKTTWEEFGKNKGQMSYAAWLCFNNTPGDACYDRTPTPAPPPTPHSDLIDAGVRPFLRLPISLGLLLLYRSLPTGMY